jgi:4-alpha-glucanotransferase
MLAEESCANSCLVIGEDLGTVPPDFPGLLARHNILSCRLLIFARDGDRFLAPEEYPRRALVSIGTHDLPPLIGFIDGIDIETRRQLGVYQDEARYHQALGERAHERQRLREAIQAAGFSMGEDNAGLIAAAYGFLARTPCALLMVQMEDLALEREQPNVPGTDEGLPNWRRKLGRNLDDIFAAPSTDTILGTIRKERPRG